ncbi:MAG: hypothetical protein E6G97_21855 [Alphaproteobacteria bacterium]|nr:MAG: hypothetical protein E6G97_21855 [Alphaproteobacteria bacterium]
MASFVVVENDRWLWIPVVVLTPSSETIQPDAQKISGFSETGANFTRLVALDLIHQLLLF